MKYHVLTKDLEIGYIDSICTCNECKKRGNVEVIINNLDDSYMAETTISKIFNRYEIIAISNDINEIKNMKMVMKNSEYYLCEFLEKELLKIN